MSGASRTPGRPPGACADSGTPRGAATVPDPPEPFVPQTVTLPPGTMIYRAYSNSRGAAEFNPGKGPGGRFSFFGAPPVPVLYGAETEQAALSETLLHDVPLTGGILQYGDYASAVAARLVVRRELRLASFLGMGLRALGVEASQLTDTPAGCYGRTVLWARAAFEAGFDGAAWMSRRCNSDRAYVLFDRGPDADTRGALRQDPGYGRMFATGADLDWLIDWCAGLGVDVYPPDV